MAMMRPQNYEQRAGLYMLKPYDLDRIPVIFVHGLMSVPQMWVPTIAAVESDPVLHGRYQFFGPSPTRRATRFLRTQGYDAASLRRGRLETGPIKAFEAPFVNDLWMADFSPGPKLKLQGKTLSTQLCLILDDHSRLIVSGGYYPAADTPAFHHAISSRCLPASEPLARAVRLRSSCL
jgi:hypothetical protein